MNMHRGTLGLWENEKCKLIYYSKLKEIADFRGVATEYILGPQPEDPLPGARLEYYRKCRGLIQKEMADLLGVDSGTLGEAERGKKARMFSTKQLR
ncbi:MAG: helix-turn-helix transcriptional regulator [Syntrophomonas sp.]